MNHTAYDIRFLANAVNREKFNDIFTDIENAASEGAYHYTVNAKRLKVTDRPKLTGMLTNLGFDVRFDSDTSQIFVGWMDKEKVNASK